MSIQHVVLLLAFTGLAACAVENGKESALDRNEPDGQRLIGSWDLLTWSALTPEGQTVHPYGESAIGMLIYTPEGTAVLSLSKGDRPLLGSDDYSEMGRDTLLEAYSGFFSYHGGYVVDEPGKRLIHNVEACKIPDWRGREQIRRYSFEGDTLVLRAEKVIGLQHELRWIRRNPS